MASEDEGDDQGVEVPEIQDPNELLIRLLTGPVPYVGGRVSRELFLRFGNSANPAVAAAVAALSDVLTNDLPTAVVVGMVAELAQRYRHLTEDEVALFDLLGRLAQGGSIYKVWIAEDDLLEAMDSELDFDGRRRLLANMKSRGLLEDGAGKWRAVW